MTKFLPRGILNAMSDLHTRLAALGVAIPEILIPRKGIDLSKWAVVACDQYTQDREYWRGVQEKAGGQPSTYELIFPEVYLEDGTEEDRKSRIRSIRAAMDSYLSEGVFAPPRPCCMYIERSSSLHPRRRGLVLALDLERYDWAPEARPLIRATEGTVPQRLPPRVEIRRGAPLDLPHILVLIDDPHDRLIPALGDLGQKQPPLYETPLMQGGGDISGWALESEEAWTLLAQGLEDLALRAGDLYPAQGAPQAEPFLFAVGDGNHSLAAAKAVWEEYKKAHGSDPGLESHPARWALVEVENLYDPGISFEPIHRVLFGRERERIIPFLSGQEAFSCRQDGTHKGVFHIESNSSEIVSASLEPLLDGAAENLGLEIDYIHGEEEVYRICSDPERHALGLILPAISKEGLFKTIARSGPLPRKSFSMGTAGEKRYYLEARRLFPSGV